MNKLEILAPAGSFDSLTAAVFCGADAVYLGSKSLNARRNAGNFDEQDGELARAVEFCHVRGVKVYQTLNILMYEQERDELVRAVETAARLGIDGVMVQDLGVAAIMRQCAPGLPIFGSTQMAVHNLAGVREAARLGCRRVVLARELSREEIRRITAESPIEIEMFVHGALCMSVSGQCYLSSMLGGRSGNRGLCAQPCRLPFAAGQSVGALSLKDLTLADRFAELRELGVASLKIEGRMKRPEYVAAAVTALVDAREGRAPDLDRLRSVFSRSGFTSGYFDGKLDASMFGLRQKEDVVAAAGVLGELERLATQEKPRVGLEGVLTAQAGEPISLALRDRDGHSVYCEGETPQAARTKPTDEERARASLLKTGGTPYFFDDLSIELGDGLMLPVSQLNALRRDALDRMTALRAAWQGTPFSDRAKRQHLKTLNLRYPTLRARCKASQLSGELLTHCSEVILPIGEIESAMREFSLSPARILAEIPRMLFSDEQQTQDALGALRRQGITRAWAGNLGAVGLAREAGLEPVGGWSLNLFNSDALAEARDTLGLLETELSFELGLQKAKSLGDELRCGLVAYGSLPLMEFRNCPMKAAVGCAACGGASALTDRMGIRFPVRCAHDGSELLNSVPLYLADRREELTGFSFVTLWFTDEDAACCGRIAAQYAGAVPAVLPPGGHTRGLYYRSVL